MNEILVDPEDQWLLTEYTWHISSYGYAATRLRKHLCPRRTYVYLHHAIMGCPIWYLDEIDHINRSPADNRRSNLRWATHSQNLVNNDQATGASGVRSVILRGGKFITQIKRGGVCHYLGIFDTLDEAVATRDEWLHQHGEYVSSTK